MRSLPLAIIVAILAPGCLQTPEPMEIPWPGAGSEAVYEVAAGGTMVVRVQGIVHAVDAAGVAREALRIDYLLRDGGYPVPFSQFVDGSGRTVVVTLPFELCADATCSKGPLNPEGRIDYIYTYEGTPGLFGMAPRWGSVAGLGCHHLQVPFAWAGPTRRMPAALEAVTLQDCGSPFPARVESGSRLLSLQTLHLTPGEPPKDRVPSDVHLGASFEPWKAPFPASWSSPEPFTLREAWDWAKANDRLFSDYLSRHPKAILYETGSLWTGSTTVIVEENRWQRTLALQDPPGPERHRIVLTKRIAQTAAGNLEEILLEESSRQNIPASLDRAALPGQIVDRASLEHILEGRLRLSVDAVSIRSYSHAPEGDHLPNGDHYTYALFFGDAARTSGVHFPYEARVNASSGRLEFLSVPQDRWSPVPPAG